ncbi:MAG: YbfB/YjiJ family MFS transporter [Proteobacteria bacterium]|nr:YbfB/YjiJ family MFS transporter [Pseudomonadota bacterium]
MTRADVFPAKVSNLGRAITCAFCTGLIGVGLARFAYTPLLPAIINAHWFAPSEAAYLGAANLAGYLAGALLGRPISARFSLVGLVRTMMLLATASFFACGFPLSFSWFFIWRFAAGFAGGAMMVLAAPTVLAHVPPSRRGLAGGLIFMGVGSGVVASGTLVPFLLQIGLRETWLGLGALSLVLTAVAWSGWPIAPPPQLPPPEHTHAPHLSALRALYVEYALNAAGWVPHMIFLVDFISRGLGKGVEIGAMVWIVFGISATFGPILSGHVADRIGFGPALRAAFALEIAAIAIPAFNVTNLPLLFVSSGIVGGFLTGTVTLVLGRIHELLPHRPQEQKAAWSVATIAFALCQAAAAYALSFVFAHTGGNYQLLFAIGAVAMTLSLAIDLMFDRRPAR